jgi:hypothetical protein
LCLVAKAKPLMAKKIYFLRYLRKADN